jgi:hypothetical protein
MHEHRWVLYETIGPGAHPCYWCGKRLFWRPKDPRREIHADHVNARTLDNRPENIVAACRRCNCNRERPNRIGEHEPVFVSCYGKRTRVVPHICIECGKQFLAVPSTGRRFCSKSCSQSAHNKARSHPIAGGFYLLEGTKRRLVVNHICPTCGKTFAGRPKRVFCSLGCRRH